MLAYFYNDTWSCVRIVESAVERKDAPQVNLELISRNSSKCSVNCGIGTITTMTVTCKGKKLTNTDNYNLMSSENCTVEKNSTPCKGTDLKCPGQ